MLSRMLPFPLLMLRMILHVGDALTLLLVVRAVLLVRLKLFVPNDDDAVAQIGVHWATEQCRDLLDHAVDGLHFYTLNKSNATLQIHRALGVRTSRQLRPV